MHAAHRAVCTLSQENNLIGRIAAQVRNQMAVLPGKVLMYEQKSHCCESRSVRTATWARQHYRSRTAPRSGCGSDVCGRWVSATDGDFVRHLCGKARLFAFRAFRGLFV